MDDSVPCQVPPKKPNNACLFKIYLQEILFITLVKTKFFLTSPLIRGLSRTFPTLLCLIGKTLANICYQYLLCMPTCMWHGCVVNVNQQYVFIGVLRALWNTVQNVSANLSIKHIVRSMLAYMHNQQLSSAL